MKSGVSLRCARSIPGAYVSLLAPGKTDYNGCHPGKTTAYILHVVPITTHTPTWTEQSQRKEQNPYVSDMLQNRSKRNDGDGQKILKKNRLTT